MCYIDPVNPYRVLPCSKGAIPTCLNHSDSCSFLGEYAKQNPQLADGLKLAEIAELRVTIYYIEQEHKTMSSL